MGDIEHVGTEPIDERLYGFGLELLKTEGVLIQYDSGAGPGMKLTWRDKLALRIDALGHRLRWLPDRVWWAFFGDSDYYD